MAVERDQRGRVRASTLDDPWQPEFGRIGRHEARAYANAELGDAMGRRGRSHWWRSRNHWLQGRTPERALKDGDLREVWLAAVATRSNDGA